jgi:hypothetical protein
MVFFLKVLFPLNHFSVVVLSWQRFGDRCIALFEDYVLTCPLFACYYCFMLLISWLLSK